MVTEAELKQVLKEGQVSEEQAEVEEEETSAQVDEIQQVEKPGPAQAEEPPDKFESRVQAEADTRTNAYREKREADTALIRSLQTQLRELKTETIGKRLSEAMKTILEGDEGEGIEPDTTEARRKAWEEVKGSINEYNKKAAEVEEVASLASEIAGKVDKKIAAHFGLFDSNPAVRAKGIINVLEDAVHFINERTAFNRILEEIPLLQKGEEVRQQIDGFVERYMELSDEKGKDLLIKQLKQEFRGTPRKKPPTVPSDSSGGQGWRDMSGDDKIKYALDHSK